jgi:hypothetical protein
VLGDAALSKPEGGFHVTDTLLAISQDAEDGDPHRVA